MICSTVVLRPCKHVPVRLALATLLSLACASHAFAGESMLYKGALRDGGKAADGTFDLQVQLFDRENGGMALSEKILLSNVQVQAGSFEVPVDVSDAVARAPVAWLQAEVKSVGDAGFAPLAGRQQIKGTALGCWEVDGNSGTSGGTMGMPGASTDALVRLTSGSSDLYLRSAGGVEQDDSSANGDGSSAFNDSVTNGPFSFAAGRGSTGTTHPYSFSFGDNTAGSPLFATTAPDQFIVRARNGVAINRAPTDLNVELTVAATEGANDLTDIYMQPKAAQLSQAGIMISAGGGTLSGGMIPLPLNNAGFFIDQRLGSNFHRRLALETNGAVTIRSSTTADVGVTMAAGSGSWSSISDRNMKTSVVPADVLSILDAVVEMPMNTWSYITQDSVRHIGPMAQDFAAAFGVGENDVSISNIDADGVALAAIQGLNTKLEAENAALRDRLAALEASVGALHAARAQ